MKQQLQVSIPDKKLDPTSQPDAVYLLIEAFVVAAERQIRGMGRGSERLEAVTVAVIRSIEIPREGRQTTAEMMARMVYTSIALKVPDNLRHSKTEPPAPPRENTP